MERTEWLPLITRAWSACEPARITNHESRFTAPDALDQVPPPRFHGDLVRGVVLPAAPVRLSRDGRGRGEPRALQGDGAQALLRHHDAGRRAHHRVRPVA